MDTEKELPLREHAMKDYEARERKRQIREQERVRAEGQRNLKMAFTRAR